MSKKALIITNVLVVGGTFTATGIGITVNALNKKNNSTPTQPTPIETTNVIFTNNSISELRNSLISIIDNEQLTREEFNSNLLENIKNNFNIDNKNIGNLITGVEFNNQSVLQITLNKNNTKYSLGENFDNTLATLNNDILSIQLSIATSNFYDAIQVSNLDNLQSTVENYISNSPDMLTADEFSNQLNSSTFKKVIADAISTTQDSIGSISYSGTTLTIAPNSPTNSKVKFSSTQSSSILVNGSLQLSIATSNFYDAIQVSNLDNLQSTVENYISNSPDMLTADEFSNQLNSSTFKKVIADVISTTQDSIGSISYSGTTLTIAPNSPTNSKVKFSSTQSSSILVNGSLQLSIATSNFYDAIQVSNLDNLQSTVENYFLNQNNSVAAIDFLNNLNNNAFKKVIADVISTTQDSIGNVSYTNNTLIITPNSSTNTKVKFTSNTSSSILINGSLQLKNPLESQEEWFTWNGTEITGLSTTGLTQERIVLPSKATSITNNAFMDNKTLISVDMSLASINLIPNDNSNRNIGLFSGASNIISISLPPFLTSIGINAFYSCTSLTSITIPDSVTKIENSVFYNCTSLTSITIPDSVTSIGHSVFSRCTSLISITIPDSVTSIGQRTFSGCTSLTSITLPNSLTSIGDYTFQLCSSLTSITIPDSVTSIGEAAFSGCTSLISITIPDGVTSIGDIAFNVVPNTCVMNVSSTWDQTLATNAGYQGKFNIISTLTKY